MATTGKFDIDVYDCTVHISICKDIKRAINYRLRQCDEETLELAPRGFFFRDKGDCSRYWIFFDQEWFDHDTVNHEKSHLVEEILRDREIRPTGEVRAYLDGCISKKFNQLFKKKKLKVK